MGRPRKSEDRTPKPDNSPIGTVAGSVVYPGWPSNFLFSLGRVLEIGDKPRPAPKGF